jgi:hypothetical protein
MKEDKPPAGTDARKSKSKISTMATTAAELYAFQPNVLKEIPDLNFGSESGLAFKNMMTFAYSLIKNSDQS